MRDPPALAVLCPQVLLRVIWNFDTQVGSPVLKNGSFRNMVVSALPAEDLVLSVQETNEVSKAADGNFLFSLTYSEE